MFPLELRKSHQDRMDEVALILYGAWGKVYPRIEFSPTLHLTHTLTCELGDMNWAFPPLALPALPLGATGQTHLHVQLRVRSHGAPGGMYGGQWLL